METYNLLIIDDDPNIRKLLNELLAGRSEFNLFIAGDGRSAVKQFAENRIDMVLTDIHMPGFTGLELMADMKKLNFKPELMVMTANATPENVETARQIGARSVILKPFDDLEVIEAEINKALFAAKAARSRRSGHDATSSVAVAAPSGPPAGRPKPAPGPPPSTPAPARPKAPLWPATKPASPATAPAPVQAQAPAPAVAAGGQGFYEPDAWESDLVGNETPLAAEAKAVPAATPKPVAPAPPAAAPRAAAPRPAPSPPPEPDVADAAHPAPTSEGTADSSEVEIPEMPSDLETIFRAATSFDTGKLRMQVPIICLQTWDEMAAIAALRRLASTLHREFYVWSASRGLVKDGGQAMGEMYRDASRALEFIRRQKNNGLYVLADFRPILDDRTIVRVLREMVMELETARLMLVLTAPRLPAPPELSQACVIFDWPAGGGGTDLNKMYQEVVAEVAATTGRVARLDQPTRDALLQRLKEMPAGRARFEIARALMSTSQPN